MALPLVYLIVRALDADADAWNALGRASTFRLLGRTTLLAASVTVASLTLALPIAWLTVRTDLPGRRVWSVLTVLPLAIPSYVGALAFVAAFGPRGSIHDLLSPLGLGSIPEIYGFPGAFLALTLFTFPYLLLMLRAGLRGMDPALEEASRSLGAGSWRTFFTVVVPQLRVPIAAGSLLVALYVVSDFGAVSILRYDTFTRAIFIQYQSSFDRAAAAVLGLELVGLVALILLLESLSRSRGRFPRPRGRHRPHRHAEAVEALPLAGAGPFSRWWWWWLSACPSACCSTGWCAAGRRASPSPAPPRRRSTRPVSRPRPGWSRCWRRSQSRSSRSGTARSPPG